LTFNINDKNVLWRDMCKTTSTNLTDSYLKSILTFLMCDNEKYSEIIVRLIEIKSFNLSNFSIFYRTIKISLLPTDYVLRAYIYQIRL
jgi:hypothetical protein